MSPLKLSLIAILVSWAGFGFCNARNILYSNEELHDRDSLVAGPNNRYLLTMSFCNLWLRDRTRPVWESNTYNHGWGCYVKMQPRGNLVIYDHAAKIIWTSNPARAQGNYVLILHPDGKIVIHGPEVWFRPLSVGIPEVVISATNFTETTATTESETPTIAMVTK